tara:strand:- start:2644 stop:3801 length:1158 start_codon:yes stop_codon:yes gene_type:complete
MAFEEDDILGGLDLSVLDGIATAPEGDATKVDGTDVPVDEEPSIFQPGLAIKEVEELPAEEEEPKVEDKVEAEGDKDVDSKEDKDTDADDDLEKGIKAEDEEEEENAFRVFAEMQRENGIIDFEDDDFEESDEWLMSKISGTVDKKVEDYKDTMPLEIKYLLDNYEEGVPLTELMNMQSQEQVFESITSEQLESNEGLQKNLVKELLTRSGWSPERVQKKLQRYEDTGVLQEEAEDALASLVEGQKAEKEAYVQRQKKEKQNRVEAHDKWLTDLKGHIGEKEEIIPGFTMSPKDKEAVYKGITKLDKNGKNEIMRAREVDPEFDLKIAYLATVLKWDFSAFERQSTSKATKKLAGVIKNTKKAGSRPSRGTSKSVDFGTMRKSIT